MAFGFPLTEFVAFPRRVGTRRAFRAACLLRLGPVCFLFGGGARSPPRSAPRRSGPRWTVTRWTPRGRGPPGVELFCAGACCFRSKSQGSVGRVLCSLALSCSHDSRCAFFCRGEVVVGRACSFGATLAVAGPWRALQPASSSVASTFAVAEARRGPAPGSSCFASLL